MLIIRKYDGQAIRSEIEEEKPFLSARHCSRKRQNLALSFPSSSSIIAVPVLSRDGPFFSDLISQFQNFFEHQLPTFGCKVPSGFISKPISISNRLSMTEP